MCELFILILIFIIVILAQSSPLLDVQEKYDWWYSTSKCLLGSVCRVHKKNKVQIKITADTLVFAIVFGNLVNVFCFNCIISNQRHSSSWNLHLIFFCMCRKRHFPMLFYAPAQYVLMTKGKTVKSSKWGLGLFNSQAVLNV